jgi:chromosome segregation ATPase
VKKIERTLEDIGLRLGMNLNCMSDEDFNNLVSMLTNLTGYTTLDFNADVEPLKSETVYSLEKWLFQMGKSLESLKRKLNDANDVISKREETIRIQREEIKSLRKETRTMRKAEEDKIKVSDKLKSVEADFQKFKDRQHSQEQKQNAIFEYKEATMKTWIKGLEEDLASKREHIRSLELAQKELQEENEKLKEQCTRGDSSQ